MAAAFMNTNEGLPSSEPDNNEVAIAAEEHDPSDKQVISWLQKCSIRNTDKVLHALKNVGGIQEVADLKELTDQDIIDICNESQLPILVRRRLINGVNSLTNTNDSNKHNRNNPLLNNNVSQTQTQTPKKEKTSKAKTKTKAKAKAKVSVKKRLYKIILVGDRYVGKTSIINQYTCRKFHTQYKATIGADFLTKDAEINDEKSNTIVNATLQMWDTAGQERFANLGVAFYRGADACVLVCDITNKESFNNLDLWLKEFTNYSGLVDRNCDDYQTQDNYKSKIGKFPFVVLANKIDLKEEQGVPNYKQDLKKWSQEHYNIPIIETSAKTSQGIDGAFGDLAKRCVENDIVIGQDNPGDGMGMFVPNVVNVENKMQRGFDQLKCCQLI